MEGAERDAIRAYEDISGVVESYGLNSINVFGQERSRLLESQARSFEENKIINDDELMARINEDDIRAWIRRANPDTNTNKGIEELSVSQIRTLYPEGYKAYATYIDNLADETMVQGIVDDIGTLGKGDTAIDLGSLENPEPVNF